MRLLSLQLEQFRSYHQLRLDFSAEDVHVLLGENGVGKTNILEAISLLSLVRSSLGSEEIDLVRWGTEHYRIRSEAVSDAGEGKVLEVVSQQVPRTAKACFLNDVQMPVEKMVGVLPTVLFLPQDLQIFTGAPSNRRKFLDRLLSQVSPEYLTVLLQYHKVLKQRNSLLKRIASTHAAASELDLWDDQLAALAAPLTTARLELIGTLQLTLPEEVRSLGEEQWQSVRLQYSRKGTETQEPNVRMEYRKILLQNRKRDCLLQTTTVGPHRDDWCIEVDGRSLSSFASRGQQRASLLALLLLQVSYVELRCGEKPVILLDDVFSELDEAHQRKLLDSLSGYQVFISTTRIPDGYEKIETIFVEGAGKVREKLIMENR
jgi:DNA replication and repair protein RecF